MRVMCAAFWAHGHAYPMLSVALALQSRGHEVIFSSGRPREEDAALAGVPFVPFPEVPAVDRTAIHPYVNSKEMAHGFRPLVVETRPDAIVTDLITFGPGLAAESLGIPYATLIIHGLHLLSRDLPPFGFGGPAGRGPVGRLRDGIMRRATVRDLERSRAELNEVRASLGLAPTDRLDSYVSPHLLLVATLPSLEIPRSDWPDRAHVIGPCLWEPPSTRGSAALPEGDGPLVLISGSTAYKGRLVQRALDAVRSLGVRAVVTMGENRIPEDVPPGVLVHAFAPHGPILEVADAVVTNGGHGIVARTLSAGVPIVVAPGHGDQRENGWRAQRSGAGLSVDRPEALTSALRRVLEEPSFRRRALEIAAEARDLDGPTRAAELVEAMAPGSGLGRV